MTGLLRARALFPLAVGVVVTFLSAGTAWSQAGGRGAALARPNVVPVEQVSRVFFARVTLNGKGPFWFTVDTGATHTVIDPATARRLALEVVEEGGSLSLGIGPGTTPVATTRGLTVQAGRSRAFTPRRVFVVPVADAAQAFRHAIDGVLGTDFLGQYVVEFDYAAGRLVLHDAVGFAYAGPGTSVPLRLERQRPLVRVLVTLADDTTFTTEMLIDTGSTARSSFNSPLVERMRLQRFPSLGMTASLGVNSLTAASVIRLRSIELGNLVFEQPELAIPTAAAGISADSTFGGLLTPDLLGSFRMVVDYPARRLFLER
jgi:predicted aspartyl protease